MWVSLAGPVQNTIKAIFQGKKQGQSHFTQSRIYGLKYSFTNYLMNLEILFSPENIYGNLDAKI